MPNREPSRRTFLHISGVLGLGAWTLGMAGCREAAQSAADALAAGGERRVLSDGEWRTLEAFADCIIPPDGDAPGAAGLGAVAFMDHFGDQRPEALEGIRHGLTVLAQRVRDAHPEAGSFADLDGDAGDAIVGRLQETAPDAFWPLQTMVVFGAFAAPAWGGNRDKAGWALLGYDDRHSWQPPFGFYDAEATQAGDR